MSIRWIFNTYSLLPEIFAGILEIQLNISNTEIKTDQYSGALCIPVWL